MKPYYEHAGITIYHGDCRLVLPAVTGDIAITDPPYNVGLQYGESVDDTRLDYEDWCRGWFRDLALSVSGPVAISCGQANVGMWARISPPTWWLCWWKPAAMGRCVVGFNNWEPIALYGRPKKQICDVLSAAIKPDASMEGHPCPKPLEWAAQQVAMLSEVGSIILDPFMGSGTVLLEAKRLGRQAIGIEIEERYCEIAAKRLSQGVLDFAEPIPADMKTDRSGLLFN
jgi:site-specific DNA-methyltransferase (adenine-specific)